MKTGLTNTTVVALAINPQSPDSLYAGTQGDGVFQSTNGGTNWTATNTGITNTGITNINDGANQTAMKTGL